MDGEAVPDFSGHFGAEDIGQRSPVVDVEVVHYQVNGLAISGVILARQRLVIRRVTDSRRFP